MKVVIADDESLARSRLQALLNEIPNVTVAAQAGNGIEAIEACKLHQPDIVFMDIRMPGMDGIEAAMHLSNCATPPAIIFTTAYDDYALQAFEAQAIDYLLKPVRSERLARAILTSCQPRLSQLSTLYTLEDASPASRTHISVRKQGNIELIAVQDIYYFRAEQKYIQIRHRGGEALLEASLKALEEEFYPQFMRIHRNALVAVNALQGIDKDRQGHLCIRFKDIDDRLDISRRFATDVRKALKALS